MSAANVARNSIREICRKQINELRTQGLMKSEQCIESPQGPLIKVEGINNEMINFCSNNYLGLSGNEKIIAASSEALQKYGAGLSSVRFICGTQTIHKELETKISRFHKREDTILFSSCFDANAGFFEAVLGPEDIVLSDELNHASIIDGIRLCKAEKVRYRHRDMADLELKLKDTLKSRRTRLIVTDGVFSMDGNVAPLPQILGLATKYKALTMVDDSHATGFFGKTGRGTEEFYDMMCKIDVITSTLGKALGGASGGYVTGPKEIVTLLRQKARPYLFSNSLPPTVIAAASKALDMLTENSSYLERIKSNTEMFREGMRSAGFRISGDDHPICPVMIGDAKLSASLAEALLSKGIFVVSFNYPVVPKEAARIRVQISAAHTPEQITRAVKEFTEAGKKLGVISNEMAGIHAQANTPIAASARRQ